jgi:short chain dehydrogenase
VTVTMIQIRRILNGGSLIKLHMNNKASPQCMQPLFRGSACQSHSDPMSNSSCQDLSSNSISFGSDIRRKAIQTSRLFLTMLRGKVAIVTGASRGIGKAISEAFAREGASLILTATKQDSLKQASSLVLHASAAAGSP